MQNVYKIERIDDYYELGELLGEGGSAIVKLGKKKGTN